jgi:hypothetical protein
MAKTISARDAVKKVGAVRETIANRIVKNRERANFL